MPILPHATQGGEPLEVVLPVEAVFETRTVKEASRFLRVSVQRVRQFMAAGRLQGRKVAGRWRVDRDSLSEFAELNRKTGRPRGLDGPIARYVTARSSDQRASDRISLFYDFESRLTFNRTTYWPGIMVILEEWLADYEKASWLGFGRKE